MESKFYLVMECLSLEEMADNMNELKSSKVVIKTTLAAWGYTMYIYGIVPKSWQEWCEPITETEKEMWKDDSTYKWLWSMWNKMFNK